MKLEEVRDPTPGARQVVVAIRAAGVNPVEAYVRAGNYPTKPSVPYTPGTDGAGVVESVGAGVTKYRAGDRVYLFGSLTGTYAAKALADESQVHPLPGDVTFEQGAGLGIPYCTAYRALFFRGKAMAGETVLVHGGSGAVGNAAIQWARAAGLNVTATAGSERGLTLVAELGARQVFDHKQPGYLERAVATATAGQGFNLILEMLANVNLNNDLAAAARYGRVVVIGSRGPVQIDPRQTMGKDLAILGMSLPNASESEWTGMKAAIAAGLETHILRPVINHAVPLAEAALAHQQVMESGSYGKIVLTP